MKSEDLEKYLKLVTSDLPLDQYVERRFTAVSETGGIPSETDVQFRGLLRDREPTLAEVLKHSRSLILAEPGGGKSVISRAAVHHFARTRERVPVFVELKEYRGDLAALLGKAAGTEVLDPAAAVDGKKFGRAYVLDGLDEIPKGFLPQLSTDVQKLFDLDPEATVLITSRQAFYAAHREAVPGITSLFYILDFSDRDISEYAKRSDIKNVRLFLEAVRSADAMDEIRNPFILSVMIEKFRAESALSDRRSENLSYMIDKLTHSRPLISPHQQRRALKMLAIAMETYSRNELTEDEALRVIKQGRRISDQEASVLLDELYASILRRTANGLSFQMRSYGEYLAAEALEEAPLDRVRELAFLDYNTPNESWLNTVSYLVELNPEVRSFFVRRYPLWTISASPAVFSDDEKVSIIRSALQSCVRERQYIVHHPRINVRRLSRFATMAMKDTLLGDLTNENAIVRGNALVLLGVLECRDIVPIALRIVKDRTLPPEARYCGVVAMVNAGSPREVPELLEALDPQDTLHVNILDVVGAIINEEQIRTVLPLVLRESTMLSATYYHWHEFRSRAALVQVLRYLIEHPHELNDIHAETYIQAILELLPGWFDAEVAELCADVLDVIAKQQIFPDHSGPLPKLFNLMRDADRDGVIARIFFERAVSRNEGPLRHIYYVYQAVVPLITPMTAQWLIDQGHSATELIKEVARYSNGEVREMLRPHSDGVIDAQDANVKVYKEEEAKKEESRNQQINTLQSRLLTRASLDAALKDFAELTESHWPELPENYREWLASDISKRMTLLDLEKTIEWKDDSLWSPGILGFLLKLIDRYALRIDPDEPLVFVVTGWDTGVVAKYHSRFSLSEGAVKTLERLLSAPRSPRAREGVVRFIESSKLWSPTIAESLKGIASSPSDKGYVQIMALNLVINHEAGDAFLEQIANNGASEGLRNGAFDSLVGRQYRPAIERALSRLTDDELKSGNVSMPDRSPLSWIANIRSEFAWRKLAALRARALQLVLPMLVGLITETIAKINRADTATLIRKQVDVAPPSWRATQVSHAIEQERTANIEAAQRTAFDEVLTRLKGATSINRLKVLCEGPRDRPVFRSLVGQISGVPDIIFGSVGGWANLRGERDPNLWLLGCKEAIIVMDGDNGRDLRKPGKPYTQLAKDEMAKLAGLPIELRVLERYGIENYFPQRVLEEVTGEALSAFFPIPDEVPILEHLSTDGKPRYSKNRNEDAAALLSLSDVGGTDLFEIVEAIAKRAVELADQ